MPTAFWRETGAGPAIVCLHSNASVSGQWRALTARLADRYRILAPDSYGAGQSPEWPSDRRITLADELDLIEAVLARAGASFVLIGHSYGAAIALQAALRDPQRVRALLLYEPTLFGLIEADGPSPNDADGIRDAVHAASAALDAGDRHDAARCFIDYWLGPGSWDATPDDRKPPIAAAVVNVRRWAHALFTEPTPLSAYGGLAMPVLYMTGASSTPAAHAVARRLTAVLPKVTAIDFPGLGHMGPVTHPECVNAAIDEFLGALG